MEKRPLRIKLKDLGLSDNQAEELIASFEKKSRHMDVITFVSSVERYGIPRGRVYSFLRNEGIDDPVLIPIFSRADLKKAGMDEDRIQEVVFSD
jgi:hypothetical protein